MTDPRVPRPPFAVVALAVIVATTAAWWALALWPLGADAPEWIARTREVCFGATRTGLPHAGGWILLIGEPIGMLAVLHVVWGTELRAGLARLQQHLAWRMASWLVMLAVASGLVATVRHVSARSGGGLAESFAVNTALPARSVAPAPPLALVDQTGGRTRLESYAGRWVMVTFAFGHCEEICPVIVQHARRARTDAGRPDVPLLVVTLDPWRDTPERLATIAAAWQLDPDDRALSGTVDDVTAALDAWRIARVRDANTGDIGHGSTIVLVDPEGRAAWRLEGAPDRIRLALASIPE